MACCWYLGSVSQDSSPECMLPYRPSLVLECSRRKKKLSRGLDGPLVSRCPPAGRLCPRVEKLGAFDPRVLVKSQGQEAVDIASVVQAVIFLAVETARESSFLAAWRAVDGAGEMEPKGWAAGSDSHTLMYGTEIFGGVVASVTATLVFPT
ncbi:hypothetical protein C1H46_002193 [Malus baccata]|uniref:Uncharacterized protein n=1 Tax=Malus baccata TaxID=106549 RepID=A0A540NNB0_MALBA|nr:hypothetical protein C1H46_002193 [Malus baccata]